MAKLGEVTDEEWEKEVANSKPSWQTKIDGRVAKIDGRVERARELGRGQGNVEVPESLRKLIADEAITNGRGAALDLASEFGISESSVSAYAKGSHSTSSYHKPDATLEKYLESRKQRITKKSLRVLTQALDSITPDKLNSIKTRDAAAIAKDMSVISKNMEPDKGQDQGGNRPQFVVYAPTLRDERSYDTIVVKDDF